ncbi:hypothetical protein HAX54_022691 [Datura stramonium]|uniref:Uncharacterized protein n=1 Tax=Datura stramonium TaxID=4076 RepID=A0ABS8S6V2_DATST|nr:hypothetical protein [Datura stramonium]
MGYGAWYYPGGSRAGAHQTRAQTRAHANPQPEIMNGVQPRVAAPKRVQEQMAKKRASSYANRSKAPIEWGAGHGTTLDGSQAGTHQTRAQTRAQVNPQPEFVNGGQPQVPAPKRVQKQVVHDAPSIVLLVVPTVALPTDVVIRLLNVLEALVPNHSGLPVPQITSQA